MTLTLKWSCALQIISWYFTFMPSHFKMSPTLYKLQSGHEIHSYLTLNYDFDIEPTLIKRANCTATHHTWLLYRVICNSHQGFKRYRATQTWRTDRRTDRAKNNLSLHFIGGRHNNEINSELYDNNLIHFNCRQ